MNLGTSSVTSFEFVYERHKIRQHQGWLESVPKHKALFHGINYQIAFARVDQRLVRVISMSFLHHRVIFGTYNLL